jgi:hypothetical protein
MNIRHGRTVKNIEPRRNRSLTRRAARHSGTARAKNTGMGLRGEKSKGERQSKIGPRITRYGGRFWQKEEVIF